MSINVNSHSQTVLVVDDDQVIRDLATAILGKSGYSVISLSSGNEALTYLKSHTPRLLILDIGMPDMNGYELADQIKLQPQYKDLPIIFLSGRTAEEDGGRSFAHGGLMLLRKPFSHQQLRDLVQLTLEAIAG